MREIVYWRKNKGEKYQGEETWKKNQTEILGRNGLSNKGIKIIINGLDQELTERQKRKLQGRGRIKTIIQTDVYKEA